jgi:hypothetical protein
MSGCNRVVSQCEIAAALGGRHNGKGWSFCCPCHDDRVPSASIRNDGLVTCFAGCPRAEVTAELVLSICRPVYP